MSRISKILILLIISFLTAISIFIIYEKTSTNSYKYLSIGDGLSKGLNPLGVKSFDYNDYIQEYLKENKQKIYYYNYSKRDISISELTNDIIYLKDRTLKNYLQTSNLIILSIGEVEIKEQTPKEEVEEDLNNLILEIKKYNSNLCLLGHYDINDSNYEKIMELNDIYKKLSKKHNIIYIDTSNITYYLKGNINIYPTIRGYKDISQLIIKAIKLKKS